MSKTPTLKTNINKKTSSFVFSVFYIIKNKKVFVFCVFYYVKNKKSKTPTPQAVKNKS